MPLSTAQWQPRNDMHPSLMCSTTGTWLWGAVFGYVCLLRGQTNNILQMIKIQVFVIYFITFLYLFIPARPPAAPTRPLPPVECCESPFLFFFYPGGVFRPSKAARHRRLSNMRRRARGITSMPPCSPPHPLHVAPCRLIVV